MADKVLGIGNPLLDILAEVPDSMLEKYKLEKNNAILAAEEHIPMYEELVKNYKVGYVAGGATQNSIRACQWMLKKFPNSCSYIGCVGKDQYSQDLEAAAKENGVNVQYLHLDSHPTGTCAVLITGHNRSMVANLGAANHYDVNHLKEKAQWDVVENAKIFYISGFFLTSSPASAEEVAKHAHETNKIFTMNLAAPFICEFFKDPFMKCYPYTDYIFGNETEALKFAEVHNFGTTDLEQIALKMSQMEKANTKRPRTVVITHGTEPTIIACDGKVTLYDIIKLEKEKVLDTTGAGDAFVGGFLAQLAQGKAIEDCVRAANYAASLVIQKSGVIFPGEPDFQ